MNACKKASTESNHIVVTASGHQINTRSGVWDFLTVLALLLTVLIVVAGLVVFAIVVVQVTGDIVLVVLGSLR